MAKSLKLETKDKELPECLQDFLKSILETDEISAILVPQLLPMKNMVMPVLVSDPDRMVGVDPLSPAFPMNAAKIVSRLTRKPTGAKIAAVMRPCEIRAFVELVKLKQGQMDDLIIIGSDCLGAYANKDYFKFVQAVPQESTPKFYQSVLAGQGAALEGVDLVLARGSRDRVIEGPMARREEDSLGQAGISFRIVAYEGGHEIDPRTLMELA